MNKTENQKLNRNIAEFFLIKSGYELGNPRGAINYRKEGEEDWELFEFNIGKTFFDLLVKIVDFCQKNDIDIDKSLAKIKEYFYHSLALSQIFSQPVWEQHVLQSFGKMHLLLKRYSENQTWTRLNTQIIKNIHSSKGKVLECLYQTSNWFNLDFQDEVIIGLGKSNFYKIDTWSHVEEGNLELRVPCEKTGYSKTALKFSEKDEIGKVIEKCEKYMQSLIEVEKVKNWK